MDDDFSYQAGDTISDELGGNYIYTGSNWESYDTGGGMDSGNIDTGGGGSLGNESDLGSIAIPDGGVDAQGNPTYVNAAGAPVTADGTPILSANARTPLEGGGFKTINPNGSVTYEDPDGSVYTVNPSGTYTTAAGTYDPKTGTFTDPSGTPNSNLSKLMNSAKGFFQKKDASGKPTGEYDWAKLAGFGAAAYGLMGGNKTQSGGWQGSIPKYTATRQQIEYNDPNRVPGSGGRRYFTDVQYGAEGAAPAAQAAAKSQAEGILANYTPAAAPVNKWGVGALKPALAMPWQNKGTTTGTTTTNTAGDATFIDPAARMAALAAENTPVKAAMGGIMPLASGRYLQGPTDGMADKIDTSIDGRQPAKLSHGEFVVPADVVSHLGNGNSDAGAKKLYSMMDKVRQARTGTKKQGKQINPDKFMPGGTVNNYAKGGIANLPVKKFETGGTSKLPASDTTTSSTLSPWVGDYVADYLGKGQALASQPYEAYKGPLTAGSSDLQKQYFSGVSNLASTGYDPTSFTAGKFDTTAAQQYMNPYLTTTLNPQLDELRRQAQINLQGELGKIGKVGGFGGSGQAVLQARAGEGLLRQQNKAVADAYNNAYDKAMAQFNADTNRDLEAQKASEASRQYGADYGIKSLKELAEAGKTERGITAEGIAADKAQWEEERKWPYSMVEWQQGLLKGLPISTQTNTQNMNDLTSLLSTLGYGGKIQELVDAYLNGKKTTTTGGTTTGT